MGEKFLNIWPKISSFVRDVRLAFDSTRGTIRGQNFFSRKLLFSVYCRVSSVKTHFFAQNPGRLSKRVAKIIPRETFFVDQKAQKNGRWAVFSGFLDESFVGVVKIAVWVSRGASLDVNFSS